MSFLPNGADISALVLAGGRGSRMGGADKGLQTLHGTPLALHALQRLQQQTLRPGALMLNANRNLAAYQAFGLPVWPDTLPNHAGPLSGFLTGFEHSSSPLLLTVPCDVPYFPLNLCQRLAQALVSEDCELAMAAAPEPMADGGYRLRPQPVFCLLRSHLRESLAHFVQAGGRKVDDWTAQHRRTLVAFDAPDEHAPAFANVNTLEQLQALARC